MPKGKLIFPANTDLKKLEVAAYLSSVKLPAESITVGDEMHVEVSFGTLDNLVKLGRRLETVKGNELDASKAAKKETAKK